MPTCVICLDILKNPAALPCGHVFCYECVTQLVRNVHPYVDRHFCPTCRQPYSITTVNPNLVPPHLQLQVSPSIRKLSLDYTLPRTTKTDEPLEVECARLRAENQSLKDCCNVWFNRARLHARSTLGLMGMVRMSKDAALIVKAEKEELRKQIDSLKRKMDERDSPLSESSSDYSRITAPLPRRYRSPPSIISSSPLCPSSVCCSEMSYSPDCPECQSQFKRQRKELSPAFGSDGSDSDSRPDLASLSIS